jgi:ATP-dependent helicase/DNAse subunit B
VDRAQLGEIGHEALRRIFEPLLRGEGLPPPEESAEIFRTVVGERTKGRSPGLAEDRSLRLLEASVVRLTERERERLAGSAWRPLALEAAFGPGEGDGEADVRGRLDRVDRGPGGEGLVIEYKLGRRFEKKTRKEIEEGTELQIPAYLLALRRAFDLRPAGAWIVTLSPPATGGLVMEGAPEPDLALPLTGEELEEMLRRFGERVVEIDGRIRDGEISVSPRDRRFCRTCDFGDVCRIEAWQGPENLG